MFKLYDVVPRLQVLLPLEVALLTSSVEQSFAIAANADARLSELMKS